MPNPFANTTLPSPRELLTALFNSLPQTVTMPEPLVGNSTRSNALRTLSNTHRSLLGTLHVLFPSIFLPALDLLDRGLVTKVSQVIPSSTEPRAKSVPPSQAQIPDPLMTSAYKDIDEEPAGQAMPQLSGEIENTIYLVQSAQPVHARGNSSASRYGTAAQGNIYIVRLAAWNCSCAAFAFSAFPASTSGPFLPCLVDDSALGSQDVWTTDAEWEFGGLSFDGMLGYGESVPCCKHLMACALAERWEGVLGGYVKTMRVGREEMAGLGAEGGV